MNKVTIKDVALSAGVSVATVSYVLNETPGKVISDLTRQKVLTAVRNLHYIPNSAAKRLKSSRSKCIAVRLATTLSIPRYYLAVQGIRAFLEPLGYSLLLFGEEKKEEIPPYLNACLNTQADGILYISSNHTDIPAEILQTIRAQHIPLSVIDCMGSEPDVNSVNYDYYASSYLRVEALLKKGIKDFVYITPSYKNYKQLSRLQGFLALLDHADGSSYRIEEYDAPDADSSDYLTFDLAEASDVSATLTKRLIAIYRSVLAASPQDTAIIDTFQDAHTLLAPRLYLQHVLHPENERIAWYDRTLSYAFPHYDAGFEAARSLIEMIEGSRNVRKLVLQPKLVPIDPALFE